MRRQCWLVPFLLLCTLGMFLPQARAERLKDLANLMGARSNQLLGYGLVVGLPNTGDDFYAGIGMLSVATMLRNLGVRVDPNNLRLRNVAAVMVTSDLPTFSPAGQRLDVTVSSIGNARSLEGGTLIATPLKGADFKVYAMSQGPLSVGGYYAQGYSGSRTLKNITTVGRIPGGAIVEREIPMEMPQDRLSISLHSPDFTTSVRVAAAIDTRLKALVPPPSADTPPPDGAQPINPNEPWAVARDSGTVLVRVPLPYVGQIPQLMAELESLNINPDWITRVVISERTGTVVLGDSVRLAPVAIAHGGLTLEVRETPIVSQALPFAQGGSTKVVQRSVIDTKENFMPVTALSPGANLGEVVKALNTLGVAPRDLVAILQALKASGALRADLEIL
jgi:flagellar P-ring protein precursor FlgI